MNCLVLGDEGALGREVTAWLEERCAAVESAPLAGVAPADLVSGGEAQDPGEIARSIRAFAGVADSLDGLVLCPPLEELRAALEDAPPDDALWGRLVDAWIMGIFHALREAVPLMTARGGGRVVLFGSTRGYTGEGEGEGRVAPGGTLYEAALSSAVTGMMTSIARDVIPQGVAVHGIALGERSGNWTEEIGWALDLWLSGLGDYACGQIYRIY
ncbi:MAG: SDR family NAD(P)-dependent oxidoreductase [Synergistales bacterium]|nr:SDR family NAD(P)-dependent oxidoreductase [Synergistales bacterium]